MFAAMTNEMPRMRKIATDASAVEHQIDLLLEAITRFNASSHALHFFVGELAHVLVS